MGKIFCIILVLILITVIGCTQSPQAPPALPSDNGSIEDTTPSDDNNNEEPLDLPVDQSIIDLAYEQGRILYSLGLFDGVSPTGYEPNLEGNMNREEAMKMIVTGLGLEPADESECPFIDVSAWAKPYVARAYLSGIAIGTMERDDLFNAKDPVTLQHLLTFYLRALGYETTYAYEHAFRLGELKALTTNITFTEEYLKRYHLVLMSFNALQSTRIDSPRSIIEELANANIIDGSQAKEYGLIKTYLYQSQRDHGPVELTVDVFEDEILKKEKALVLFYQKDHPPSHEMLLPINHAAIALADIARVGQIEASQAGDLIEEYQITSFPTLKAFRDGISSTLPPVAEAETLVQWMKNY